MIDPMVTTTYGAMLLAALAGSLHCVGMCGPILLAFSGAMRSGQAEDAGPAKAWSFLWYHVGRIWTYGMLGLFAGFMGSCVRHSSSLTSWQRAVGITAGAIVMFIGLALMGFIPGLRLDRTGACGIKRIWSMPVLRGLLRSTSVTSRLLLGAIMGLLPCGLVYSMLAIVASLPSPMYAALGMVIFGIGTIPSLTAVLASSRFFPARWRSAGTTMAAMLVVATGAWITVRSVVDLCAGH